MLTFGRSSFCNAASAFNAARHFSVLTGSVDESSTKLSEAENFSDYAIENCPPPLQPQVHVTDRSVDQSQLSPNYPPVH